MKKYTVKETDCRESCMQNSESLKKKKEQLMNVAFCYLAKAALCN